MPAAAKGNRSSVIVTTVNGKFQYCSRRHDNAPNAGTTTSATQQFHFTAKIVHVVIENVHYISSNVHNDIRVYGVQIKDPT